MGKINVLDVTLRDGGCVNNFNFGQVYMEKILAAQEASGVNVIEMGYLDENKGTQAGRTQWKSIPAISDNLLKEKKAGIKYVAMMDYGKYSVEKFPKRTEKSIDGIRVAFHKKNMHDIVPIGKQIMDKGYEYLKYGGLQVMTSKVSGP